MSSTMTVQLGSPPPMDRTHSRYSNSASAPLPLIPRRPPSISRSNMLPTTPVSSKTAVVKVQPPTPPDNTTSTAPQNIPFAFEDSDVTSSSISDGSWPTFASRSRRIRGQRLPTMCPPELSTPTPAVFKASMEPLKHRHSQRGETRRADGQSTRASDDLSDNDTPRPHATNAKRQLAPDPLRLDLSAIQADRASELSDTNSAETSQSQPLPVVIPPAVEAKLVRKKSGQLVKSSLKSSKPQVRGSLSVVTRNIPSKSEPNTPTHAKAVHFDACLEHVKLFLAEQKPLAVSRGGSPTTDTSGTDNDFPSFIYGKSDTDSKPDGLTMKVINMPPTVNMRADVALEELKLSQDMKSILGNVRVRNFDYHKWIAVRFTFDSWQTISEVAAKHTRSLNGGEFDRFTFSIRLNDLLARIEEKTLLMALRYTVQGRDIWDNNSGQNYLARFTKSKAQQGRSKSEERSSSSDIADLKSRLESVVDGSVHLAQRPADAVNADKPPTFKEVTSLASRYDLTAAFKSPWKPPSLPPPPLDSRHSYPSRNSIPWPKKGGVLVPPGGRRPPSPPLRKRGSSPLGSPRELGDEDFRPVVHIGSDADDLPFHRNRQGRHHQRSYFDVASCETGNVRRTPPGTPLTRPHDDKAAKPLPIISSPDSLTLDDDDSFYATPFGVGPGMGVTPRSAAPQFGRRDSGGDSEESTPSIISPSSSSRSVSPSPTEIFMMTTNLAEQSHDKYSPTNSPADYSQFLNKFCFYTGSENLLDTSSELLPRSQSASSIDTLLSTPSSPRFSALSERHLSPFSTPTRTQSFDETVYRSGSSTPTPKTLVFSPTSPNRFNSTVA